VTVLTRADVDSVDQLAEREGRTRSAMLARLLGEALRTRAEKAGTETQSQGG
jgi:hypothetical protein